MSKLTAKKVENAKPRKKEYKLHDGGGLFLRVRSSGAKSWLFAFSLPKDRRIFRMTLGSVDELSLKQAREVIPGLRRQVAEGIDPRNARAATRTENVQAITMQKLFNDWIEFLKLTGEVTPTWIKRHEDRWRLHLKVPLANLFAKDVTRGHLAFALDSMVRKGIKEETRKALTTLNLMLDYGLTRHFIEQNPARMLKPKDFAASANHPRERVLSIEELRQLWVALDRTVFLKIKKEFKPVMNPMVSTAIKLLILTGARRGEVCGMRWDELDLEKGLWKLPSSRTKNRKSHLIYLSSFAVQLISDLKPLTGQSDFVLDTGVGSIHRDSVTGAIKRLLTTPSNYKEKKKASAAPLAPMKPFSTHDLRRSSSTAWAEYLKVQPHVIERMLNHQPLNKLVATYQRATYAEEQKAAWLAWSDMVESQIARDPGNVISIKWAANV